MNKENKEIKVIVTDTHYYDIPKDLDLSKIFYYYFINSVLHVVRNKGDEALEYQVTYVKETKRDICYINNASK